MTRTADDLDVTWLRGPGVEVGIIAHGARIVSVRAPDRDGHWAEVVLGLPDEDAYRRDTDYLGACVGRFANRIAGGRFTLDGRPHRIPTNEPRTALHGGPAGFDHADWRVGAPVATPRGGEVVLRHTSPDGDGGFPGTLEVELTYRVEGAELTIATVATTDAPTVVNLTNHAYWNLAGGDGDGDGDGVGVGVEDHEVTLAAGRYLPVDDDLIPHGPPAPVAGTPFDLRIPTRIGAHVGDEHPQLRIAGGYDHTFVLDGPPGPDGLRQAARVVEPRSGRTLELRTDQPGVQFYSGNMLDGTLALRGGGTAQQRGALCLEPQHFPDSPNRPDFPATVLRPGQVHRTRSVLRLGTAATGSP